MQAGESPIHVAIIDGDHDSRSVLLDVVARSEDLHLCHVVQAMDEIDDALLRGDCEVVVIHVHPQCVEQLDLIRRLRKAQPDLHVVVVSDSTDAVFAERTVHAGALGYVTLSSCARSLADAIRAASRREAFVSRKVLGLILGNMISDERRDPFLRLTNRELAVFERIGRCNLDDIARELGLSRKTVEVYRRRIRTKLDFDSIEELCDFARQWGTGLSADPKAYA